MSNLQGHLLAASPYMGDTSFSQSVVLLLHHSGEGAFGVVLNHPANETIKALWEQFGNESVHTNQRLNLGGPVSGPVMALHTVEDLGELEIPPGIYLAAERSHLQRLLCQDEHPFKIFVGHAGWGKGQLENELAQGAWLTLPATRELVFEDDEDLWNTVIKQIGSSIIQSALKIRRIPPDPTVN